MIHYTCDRCHRCIDPRQEIRYTVRIEIMAAADEHTGLHSMAHDHLDEIEQIIDGLESGDLNDCESGMYRRQVFDLCSSCHDRFVRDPVGRETQAEVGFSEN